MGRFLKIMALLLTLLSAAGCSGLSYEELYSLPRASEDYYDLQEALSTVQPQGSSYLAPSAGARQEPVQLVDLDGDGVDEAVAFFRTADQAVKIYIFSQNDGVYTPVTVIDGAGSSIAAVEYADLDGGGSSELLITSQVSESVPQALQVFRYGEGDAANLLTTGCSRYALQDLDGDGVPELLCLTDAGPESPAVLECYRGKSGELVRLGEQRLRYPYESLRQTMTGTLDGGAGTVIYAGVNGEGLLMLDLFTVEGDGFMTVTPNADILTSQPVHGYYAYPRDMDGDGCLEIPQTRQLAAYDEGSAAQWVVDWYGLRSDGTCEKRLTAYHNFSEGWYLELLPPWEENLVIKALDENTTVSTVTLYQQAAEPREILTVYTLRGQQRQAYAEEHSLTILLSGSETIYAVTLAAAEPWAGTATIAQVSELFHYTQSSEDTE